MAATTKIVIIVCVTIFSVSDLIIFLIYSKAKRAGKC
jgi:hypothetical protein